MNQKPKILFITDGNRKIGYGHISRSIIIARKFTAVEIIPEFLMLNSSPFINKVRESNFKVTNVPNFDKSIVFELIKELVQNHNVKFIIIDLTEDNFMKLSWLREFRRNVIIVSITLFLFKDTLHFEHLSFFPSINEVEISTISNHSISTELYSGRKFLVFNDSFFKISDKTSENVSNILITMGGSDPKSLTLLILESLAKANLKGINLTIILSKVSSSFNDVQKVISNFEHVNNIKLLEHTDNMALEMEKSDLIILNGGLTRYEASISHTPFVAISIDTRQYLITEELTSMGAGLNLGVFDKLSHNEIMHSIIDLIHDSNKRLNMIECMKQLNITNGADNILEIILSFYLKEHENT